MARACGTAFRLQLPPNPITPQLPICRTNAARSRGFAAHAQPRAGRRDDEPAADSPKKQAETTQSYRRRQRRGPGSRQSLVSVGTSCGGGDQWSSDFDLTLRQLHLDDLIEDGQNDDADVLVHLLVQQHTQFGMSIKGRVVTSFSKICDTCSSPYYAKGTISLPSLLQIDEQFNLTVLSSIRKEQSRMPDIGDSDPSSSCSEACEKSTVVWQYGSNEKRPNSQRWSKLLDLKKTLDKAPN
uniref:Uncharacterized protein n=1 Tax=Leersia perrieri TaxID=77586 RepID=A0A0D9W7C0_9ORYZ